MARMGSGMKTSSEVIAGCWRSECSCGRGLLLPKLQVPTLLRRAWGRCPGAFSLPCKLLALEIVCARTLPADCFLEGVWLPRLLLSCLTRRRIAFSCNWAELKDV